MKRIMAAATVALLALTVAAANAEMVGSHLVSVPVMFRTQGLYATLAALDPAKAKRTSGTAGYVDSAGYCRSSVGSSLGSVTTGHDTTVAIQLTGTPGIHPVAGGDSLIGRLIIQEAGGAPWCSGTTTANGFTAAVLKGLDSIYVSVEVSAGGSIPRWTRVATMLPYVYAVADTSTGRIATWPIKAGAPVGTSNTGATLGNISAWPYIRFIITNDFNTSTSCFEATWQYWSNNSQDTR